MDAPPPYSENDTTYILPNTHTSPNLLVNPRHSLNEDSSSLQAPTVRSSVTVNTPLYRSNPSSNAVTNFLASSSAAAFFESRPVTQETSGVTVTHLISLTRDTSPVDLVYPPSFQANDVFNSDWLTFLNYLLPDHVLRVNSDSSWRAVGDTLEDSMQRLDVDVKVSSGTISPPRPQPANDYRLSRTVAEWNEGFFEPRGLHIAISYIHPEIAVVQTPKSSLERTARTQGTWIPYDHEIIGESSSAGRRRGFFGGFKGFQAGSPSGFRIGPIVADNEGFRMGSVIIADQNGLRLGGSKGFVADDSGVSMGGRSFFRREVNDPERSLVASGSLRKGSRSTSISSASSLTSEESFVSEDLSIGSLPDYDDLKDQQLPTAKRTLTHWLRRQTQPLDRAIVSQIRDDIDACENFMMSHHGDDLLTLRSEVRDLLKEFRERKRKQKREQRQSFRERRALKKSQRIERRTLRREARHLKREVGCCKANETSRRAQWMASRSTLDLPMPYPPPVPSRPSPNVVTRTPVPGAASVASFHSLTHVGLSSSTLPETHNVPGRIATNSMSPHSRDVLYTPGNLTTPPVLSGVPTDISIRSDLLYTQAHNMDALAWRKHERAIWLRAEASSREFGDYERSKRLSHASAMDDEAQNHWVEAERLRAEALRLVEM